MSPVVQKRKPVSPLRYPGGKAALAPVVSAGVKQLGCRGLVEPFAGGAGVGLALLADETVDHLVLADSDCAIASFWQAIAIDPGRLADMFGSVELSMDEWAYQKDIYNNPVEDIFSQALSTLYLSRTCYSGNLNAGPVGGWSQAGSYTIASRFYRQTIVERILALSTVHHKIEAFHAPFQWTVRKFGSTDSFLYIDPPYPRVGDRLYRLSFTWSDHVSLFELISKKPCWLVSYGQDEKIRKLWGQPQASPELQYSGSSDVRRQQELLYACPRLGW